jgi:hypothetical protein
VVVHAVATVMVVVAVVVMVVVALRPMMAMIIGVTVWMGCQARAHDTV